MLKAGGGAACAHPSPLPGNSALGRHQLMQLSLKPRASQLTYHPPHVTPSPSFRAQGEDFRVAARPCVTLTTPITSLILCCSLLPVPQNGLCTHRPQGLCTGCYLSPQAPRVYSLPSSEVSVQESPSEGAPTHPSPLSVTSKLPPSASFLLSQPPHLLTYYTGFLCPTPY